ncbi:DUF3887 domain-containing protein [Polluticoccus soli]|uniref:DUF3887 domain-containing protein n=1 Tax=Polluticoccus soli TaxID=3034150 RepID=UPI0023E150C0|nr:DUF3887 domain-containing protein [Flavipsychrobacter sp. JY13-12]
MMRFLLLFLLFVFLALHLYAQQEPLNYKTATKELKQAYNDGSYTRFRLMLSDLVEEQIPMQELAAVFDALKPTYGQISAFHFLGVDEQGARYTVRFQKGALDVLVLLDSSNKISRLEFEHYKELINAAGVSGRKP